LRRLLFFGVLFLAVLAVGQATRGGENARAAAEDPAPPSALLPDPAQISAGLAEGHRSYLEELSRREQELAQPQAVAARLHSRSAHVDLSAAEAQQLAFSTFAATFAELDEDPARFLSDARLDRVVESDAATVTSEGDTQLLEAGMPVRAEDEEGELAKVDLGVVPSEDGWELENPLVEVEVGGSAEEGITLPEAGVTVVQAGAEDSAARLEDGSDLFFPEVEAGTDTDLIVSPIANGVELFDVLRSPASPETLRFQLQIPSGAELRPGPAGSAEVVADGEVSVHVPKPWAHDAQGTAVPVEMTVEGNSLVLAVEHRDQDLAYPILVDPTIYQDWGWWYNGQNLQGLGAFYFQTSASGWWAHGTYSDPGGFPGYDNRGLFVWSDPGNLGADQWGQWVRTAPNGGSYLAAATINPFWRNDNPCNDPTRDYQPYDYEGMWNGEGGVGWNELRFNDAKNYGYTTLNTWGRALIFGLSTDWRGRESPCYRHLMAGGVGIWLDDWQNPTVSITALPTGWIKKDATARSLSVSAADGGLGVQSVSMTSPISAGWNQAGCAGTYDNPCLGSRTGTIGFTTSSLSEGAVGVTVQVSDPTAKKGSASGTIYVDGTAPTLSLSGSSTPSTYELQIDANDGGPGVTRSGVKEVKVYLDGQLKQTKTGTCSTAGCGASLSFKYSQSLVGLSQGTHTVEVVATDQVGYTKSSQTTFKIEAPDTVIDSGPDGLTKQATPTFTYHSTLAGSTFSCSIDGGAYVSCPSGGYTTPKLLDGKHTFSVKATSGAGIADPTPATRSFTVDATAPDTFIDSGPGATTNDPRPLFGYRSNEEGARFECRLDAGSFAPCGLNGYEPDAPLADGPHTFAVRAIDAAGNVDATPASRTFSVDSTPPTVTIQSGPSGPTNVAQPTFTFTSSGASSLLCAIDPETGGPEEPSWGPCTTSTSYVAAIPLADGSYIFRVRASDEAGNRVTDDRSFRVDTVAPQTTIDSGPTGVTDNPKPSFGFSSSEPDSSFKCRFDSEAFRACSGPGGTETPAAALADGLHTFEVRATDPAGNADLTPASRAFTVSTGGPQTTIDSGPEGAIGVTSATFKYSADEPATFQCRLDAAPFLPCPAGEKSYVGLTEGEHTFEVRAINNAAVIDPTPAQRSFVVDTTAPSAPAVTGAVREPGVPGLTLRLEGKDGEASGAARRSGVEALLVKVDGQLAETYDVRCKASLCPATVVRNIQLPYPLVIGTHDYEVLARDGLGHVSPAAAWKETTAEEGTLLKTTGTANKSGPCAPVDLTEGEYGKLNRVTVERNKPVVTGSPEADLIISKPGVATIRGLGGCDVIVGNLSKETIVGGGGNDLILGARSNDIIKGGDGNDFIYGGIGDDRLFGGTGNDVIDGNPGADVQRGEQNADTLRGGQGEDKLNGGGDEGDTVSYADAFPIGFAESKQLVAKAEGKSIGNFPQTTESGVYMELGAPQPKVYNGNTGAGGGTDIWIGKNNGGFKRIVGSPFSDWIEGTAGAKVIDPGPGPDVVYHDSSASVVSKPNDSVNGTPNAIGKRDSLKVEVGIQRQSGSDLETDLYMIGSDEPDNIRVRVYRKRVQFIAKGAATKAALDPAAGCKLKAATVSCQVKSPLGALVLFGGNKKDTIFIQREEGKTPGGIELIGGPGTDRLHGGPAGELLIDGIQQTDGGQEHLSGGAGDDALFQGDGADEVSGGGDNDLVVNADICDGDLLRGDVKDKGDTGSDNAQFHPVRNVGVYANLEGGKIGELKESGGKNCPDGKQESLLQFNDLEGSPRADYFRGTQSANLIIGRGGVDQMFSLGKNDQINAKDKNKDEPKYTALDDNVHCGPDDDVAHVDTQKEKRQAENEGCEEANFKGKTFPYREFLSGDRASEPPLLGEVSSVPFGPGPTAYYEFEETEGTTAQNSVEESPSGTYKAVGVGPSVNGPGPTIGAESGIAGEEQGAGVKLDGVDDYVDLAGQGVPTAESTGYAALALVKFAQAPSTREFVFSGSNEGKGGEGIYLYRDPDGRLVFATGLDQGAPKVKTPGPVNDQKWHQVVASIEGETMTLNVDGFPYRLGLGENAMPKPAASPQSLLGAGPGPANLLAGNLDEVGFLEGQLSVEEAVQGLAESSAEEPQFLLAPPAETADNDGDGVTDGADNCPSASNSDQADANMDGLGDACAPPDGDGDGVDDASDNCPFDYNPEQTDTNGDGMGDECSELPPEAETTPASNVKGATATLNGTVDPEGAATTYWFEYGTTTAYGSKVPFFPASAGSGVNPIAVNAALSGLQPNTTYHFRVVASNEFGETEGDDQTFTTMKLPVVKTQPATKVTDVTATLNGTVNPEGEATTYQFEYGKTTAYGSKAPVTAASAGSGNSAVTVSEAIAGLAPGTTYHYRLVATNGGGTVNGSDVTFTTSGGPVSGAALAAMPVTEPFDGSTGSLANFSSQWTALGWANGSPAKGENSTSGWRPVSAFPTVAGAYYNPTLTDTGSGVAAVATLAGAPTIAERYFSLWLDMATPGTTRAGYELRFTEVSAGTYDVALSKWTGGTQLVLTSKSSYPLPAASSFAIVDQGSTVSAWTNTGAGFTQLMSATDATYSSGKAGIEGAGNILRLSNFKAGVPGGGGAGMDGALSALTLNDSFATNETPLSKGGSWEALQWTSSGSGYKTGQVSGGWGPYDAFPTINGAYWKPSSFTDSGSGVAAGVTLTSSAMIAERYFSLWLHMPAPPLAKSGYELRFTETSSGVYTVTMSRWQNGTATALGSKTSYAMPVNSQVAIARKAGVVSAWVNSGSGFTQILSASDSTFTSGYTGIEGSGNIQRLTNFRSGQLAPF
jgi:hypothetical protein